MANGMIQQILTEIASHPVLDAQMVEKGGKPYLRVALECPNGNAMVYLFSKALIPQILPTLENKGVHLPSA
jgi:hypothetical protein